MIHPFTISTRTVHQLETFEAKEQCCFTATVMGSDQDGTKQSSSQWACRTRHSHAANLFFGPQYQFFSRWPHPTILQNP